MNIVLFVIDFKFSWIYIFFNCGVDDEGSIILCMGVNIVKCNWENNFFGFIIIGYKQMIKFIF